MVWLLLQKPVRLKTKITKNNCCYKSACKAHGISLPKLKKTKSMKEVLSDNLFIKKNEAVYSGEP